MPTTYAIPNGRTVFDATLYTSNGTTQTVTNNDLGTVGFKPDLVWQKTRSVIGSNWLTDSVRGAALNLNSNNTNAETSLPLFVTSFNSNGFSIGTDNFSVGSTLVTWQWQAGAGTTTTNNVGSISSQVSVNTTAGFSIVTYTGNGVASTVGHGLGVAPSLVIVKNRTSTTQNWAVYSSFLGVNGVIFLNATDAFTSVTGKWSGTNSSVIGLNTASDINQSGSPLVAYCWAPIAGFSQFGSYTGNGSSDGPFIYTGFRPKFFLYKSTSYSPTDWNIVDTSRDTYNASQKYLRPNTNGAEGNDGDLLDLLSNGIKIRRSFSDLNRSGENYIYMAFAENPLKFANAR